MPQTQESTAVDAAAPPSPSNLAPDTGAPLSRSTLIRFGVGFFGISLLWAIGLNTIASVLLPQRLKDIGVDNPTALLGSISAVTALVSLVSNLVFGNLSDRTRSRFGKRSPWVVCGGVLGGLSLFAIGVLANSAVITVVYCVCMVGLNMMLAPAIAVLSDRVPESIRGTMSTFWGVGASVGYPLGAIVGARFISESGASVSGFTLGGVLMGIAGLFAVLVWPREKSAADEAAAAKSLGDVLRSFIPPTRGAGDFWKAFFGRFTMLISYQMINAYQLYIIQDYLGLSTEESGATVTVMSSITLVVGLVGGFLGGPLSDILKRRKVPVVMASLLFALGVLMPWIMPTTTGIYLFALIAGC